MPTQKTRREERVRERERRSTHTHTCRRELPAPGPLAPLFLCFFLPDLPCANWASQECPLFCRRSSLWSSDLPLFYFHGLFPSLSFSLRHLDSFSLFDLPNNATDFFQVLLPGCVGPGKATDLHRNVYGTLLPDRPGSLKTGPG